MAKKIEIYEALGFPIAIENPRYIEFAGEKVLDVNPGRIMKAAFKAVINKPARLSGAEVKFLRGFMQLSQEDFSRMIGVERSIISKWQDKKQKFTGMDVPTEVLLRIQCQLFIDKRPSIRKEFFNELLANALASKDVGDVIRIAC